MTTQAEPLSQLFCAECGRPIEPGRGGPPRRFCSDKCRNDHWYRQHRRAETTGLSHRPTGLSHRPSSHAREQYESAWHLKQNLRS